MKNSDTSSLFRKQALEYYTRSRTNAILPRLAQPPVFLLLWILLCLAGVSLIVTWFGQVPVYVHGTGIVIQQLPGEAVNSRIQYHEGSLSRFDRQREPKTVALVFVPLVTAHPFSLHVGTRVQLQIGTQEQLYKTVVTVVEPGIFSPAEIQRRYAPGNEFSALITGPSLVVSIELDPSFASQFYTGSLVHAQFQVGSMSVFSSLFGSAQPFGV